MSAYAIIKTENSTVQNLVEWDGKTPYSPPEGCFLVLLDGRVANQGDKFDGSIFYQIAEDEAQA